MNQDQARHDELVRVLTAITHGDKSRPLGLEALTMALVGQGEPGSASVLDAIDRVADGLEAVASAIASLGEQ